MACCGLGCFVAVTERLLASSLKKHRKRVTNRCVPCVRRVIGPLMQSNVSGCFKLDSYHERTLFYLTAQRENGPVLTLSQRLYKEEILREKNPLKL